MTQPTTTDSFFNSGGGKTAKFPNIGDSIEGEITFISEPEPQTKLGTDEPVIDQRTGKPRLQVRVGLATDQRDPDDEDDTGARTLFVKGFMRGSIGDALRKAGAKSLEVGGRLRVTHTGTKDSGPGLNPTKLYEATYMPPSAAATSSFFGQGQQSNGLSAPAAAVSNPLPAKPASIEQSAWDAMPDDVKRSVAATLGAPADSGIPF